MRPDAYYARSPDCVEVYGEQGANTNVNHFSIRDQAVAFVALVIASGCLGAFIVYSQQQSGLTDAKIKAAIAEPNAQANEAKVNARVALKEVDTLCASLRAAKVPNVECH